MNAAAQLKWVMAGLRRAQPLDPPQSLTLFSSGSAMAITQWGTLQFESFRNIETFIDYASGKTHNENLGGDGI